VKEKCACGKSLVVGELASLDHVAGCVRVFPAVAAAARRELMAPTRTGGGVDKAKPVHPDFFSAEDTTTLPVKVRRRATSAPSAP